MLEMFNDDLGGVLAAMGAQDRPAEPVRHRGFGVRYERRLNLGRYESVTAGISLWVLIVAEQIVDERGLPVTDRFGDPLLEPYDLHACKRRVRELARANVRAQFNRARRVNDMVTLGLPPVAAGYDPLRVKSVLLTLQMKRNLGNFNMVAPEYSDHCDLRDLYLADEDVHSANNAGLHVSLDRIWRGLWANLDDELSRATGAGETGASCGLPAVKIEGVASAEGNGRPAAAPAAAAGGENADGTP